MLRWPTVAAAAAALLAACGHAGSAAAPSASVRLIAFNDFHGYIDPPGAVALPASLGSERVPLGGAANLAAKVAALRTGHPYSVVVGAGDMVGASPLDSALFHDEPAIQALGRMGLEYTSVGNHEFDQGAGRAAAPKSRMAGAFRPASPARTPASSTASSRARLTATSPPTSSTTPPARRYSPPTQSSVSTLATAAAWAWPSSAWC